MRSRIEIPLRVAAALLVLTGCGKPTTTPQTVTRRSSSVTIFYTCDTRGHIEPCACAGGHEGGIARRATCLARQRPASAACLLVDAGDVTAGPREWEQLELQYLLSAYQLMGYHAVNAGWREASLDGNALRDMGRQCDKLISANLVGADNQPVLPPYVITTLPNGTRAGILGVLDDRLPAANIGRGLRVLPAADAIARHLPALKKEADLLVLLAFADETAIKELAARFYEFQVVIGGRVPQSSPQPLAVNRSWVVYVTDKGKRLGRLDLTFDATGAATASNDVITLDELIPDDPQMEALIADWKLQQQARGYPTGPKTEEDEGLSLIGAPGANPATKERP